MSDATEFVGPPAPRVYKPQQWWMGLRKPLARGRIETQWATPDVRLASDNRAYQVHPPVVFQNAKGEVVGVKFPPWRRLTDRVVRPGAARRARLRAERTAS